MRTKAAMIAVAASIIAMQSADVAAQGETYVAQFKIEIRDPKTNSTVYVTRSGGTPLARLDLCLEGAQNKGNQNAAIDTVRSWDIRTASGELPTYRIASAECQVR